MGGVRGVGVCRPAVISLFICFRAVVVFPFFISTTSSSCCCQWQRCNRKQQLASRRHSPGREH